MSASVLLSLLLVSTGVNGFKVDFGKNNSQSHWEITETAILNVTARSCHDLAQSEDRDFTFPASLTAESLLEACAAKSSARDFAINTFYIKAFNALVNTDYALIPSRHFDDESFHEGKKHITDGLDAVKASIKEENYVAARTKLGEILHTLQDFYSHSNWIEMGNVHPNTGLIKKNATIGNITAKDRPTCRNCTTDCTNNILEDILNEKLLTSAYFSPLSSNSKPKGKCSHGGIQDKTRHTEATGGINKDSLNSSHGHLHTKAAEVATAATYELLDDVRAAAGDKSFLRMMGVSPGKALCFVIDTTGSMGFDIEAVQHVTSTIISNLQGSINEPSVYILVPFNDPDFGPETRTTDLTTFKQAIDALTPSGGGDEPEMSLSALQLALTAAPFGSEIYLFTDATAKDSHLKNIVIALIERTQSVVNFVISKETLQEPIYTDVAKASGGLLVKGSKGDVFPAIKVFLDASSSNLVTLLHIIRNPGKPENFTFTVDGTETDIIIFITGTTTKDFALISPSGTAQDTTGSQTVGDLLTLKLKTEVGQWEIRMRSTKPYTLKITAQSSTDFFFTFLKPSQVRSEGYAIMTNRPAAGFSAELMVILFGSDTATLTEVNLVYLSGSVPLKGNVTEQGNNTYLVSFENIPSEEFSVLVKLQHGSITGSTPGTSQRQSTTSVKASSISVDIKSDSVFEPNSTLSAIITVSTRGTGGNFTTRAINNKGFDAKVSPSTVTVPEGGSANATVQMTAPVNTSGTEVTLVVEVEAPRASDMNYVVSTFIVLTEVNDSSAPVFERLTPEPNCSDICSSSTWQLSIHVTDNTAIDRVYVRQGNGTLSTSRISGKEWRASYEASCCSPTVEMVAVDGVGNVEYFLYTVSKTSATTTTAKPTTTQSESTTTTRPITTLVTSTRKTTATTQRTTTLTSSAATTLPVSASTHPTTTTPVPTTTTETTTTTGTPTTTTTTTTTTTVSVAPKTLQSSLLCIIISLLASQLK
uniref:von Willebrand factor A domain-containing protein 7-like n=1 Tax=Neogobius melanostomus TaxID=47308 RepID=A0A8C6T049_9GOBI